jgi:hypothetical protein
MSTNDGLARRALPCVAAFESESHALRSTCPARHHRPGRSCLVVRSASSRHFDHHAWVGPSHLKERRRVARATNQRQENSSIRCAARTRVRIADLVTNASVARDVFACEGGLWCVSFQLLSSTTIGSSRGVPPPTARTRFRLLVASTFIAAHVGSRDEVERTSSAGRGAFSSLCSLSTHELRCGTVADSTGAEPLHDGAIAGDKSKRTSTSRVGVATSTGG